MFTENLKIQWGKISAIGLSSLLALFFAKNKPVLKWIVATFVMIVLGFISVLAISILGLPAIAFFLMVVVLNILICLVIKAPPKWIIGSSIGLSIIYCLIRFVPRGTIKTQ